MDSACQKQFQDSRAGGDTTKSAIGIDATERSPAGDPRSAAKLVEHLNAMLTASPVDLARISGEIRALPDLETLIMRLTPSLVLSPDSSITTLEEAAVVLGTARLRVLVYAWSLVTEARGTKDSREAGESASREPTEWTAETLYLTSLLRWLGMDSPGSGALPRLAPCRSAGVASEEVAELTEILMRDFMSLIPILDPAILRPRAKRVREA
ncbi:MAG TPA: HDOD domain-containing protein [Candidatus Acidoferrales bacterium]|nr:HDOD domain-containing protein [Candidatus Acidoferrales bacterium]